MVPDLKPTGQNKDELANVLFWPKKMHQVQWVKCILNIEMTPL